MIRLVDDLKLVYRNSTTFSGMMYRSGIDIRKRMKRFQRVSLLHQLCILEICIRR
jgi:hypothetical protein